MNKLAQWTEREAELQRELSALRLAVTALTSDGNTHAARVLRELLGKKLDEIKAVQHHVEVLKDKCPADFFSFATPNLVFN